MKVRINLKANKEINGYKEGTLLTIYNDMFDRRNGIAFFPIDKEWDIVSVEPLVYSKNNEDYYENDKVLVRGTKKIGTYESKIIKSKQGYTLEVNNTLINDDSCFVTIINKIDEIK